MKTSQRIYRFLLKAYPEAYRRQYEGPMAQLFADQLRVADTWTKLVALWLRTFADLLRTLPARHVERPTSVYGIGRVLSLPYVPWNQASRRAIFFACEEASSFGRREISAEHMLAGLLREENAIPELAVAREAILREVEAGEAAPRATPPTEDLPVSRALRGILSVANEDASRARHSTCTPRHLLAAILQQEQTLASQILRRHGITTERLASGSPGMDTRG
jgi:hypothetical protein